MYHNVNNSFINSSIFVISVLVVDDSTKQQLTAFQFHILDYLMTPFQMQWL